MELKKITENVYYIPGSSNIGVLRVADNDVVLIDTGLDEDYGKKILNLLNQHNFSVKAIINTHSHADHCGGNHYIKSKTSAIIYAPEIESAIIMAPYIEPLYLFSGAEPLTELYNKFLMATPSVVDHVILRNNKSVTIGSLDIKVLQLPGHSPNQIGLIVDDVLFCADAIFSEDIIRKHKIPFYIDIDKAKETLMMLKNSSHLFYVPSHAEPRDSLSDLVDINLAAINSVEDYFLNSLRESQTTEQALDRLCKNFGIKINSAQQYYLMNTINMAYLSSLHKNGKTKISFNENILQWQKV
jgi:glyoxylase-like metal-dependent hydrolase (beta-lactamase superfamily II)